MRLFVQAEREREQENMKMRKVSSSTFFLWAALVAGLFFLFFLVVKQWKKGKDRDLETFFRAHAARMEHVKIFKINDEKVIKFNGYKVTIVLAENGPHVARVRVYENLRGKEGKNYLKNQSYVLESLFNDQQVPYPGRLSKTLRCPIKYRPEKLEEESHDSKRKIYFLYANDRFTSGGCSEDLLKYRVAIAFVYCKRKRNFFRVEFFTPKNEPIIGYKDIVRSFRCDLR